MHQESISCYKELEVQKDLEEQPDNTLPGTWRYCTSTELVTGQK